MWRSIPQKQGKNGLASGFCILKQTCAKAVDFRLTPVDDSLGAVVASAALHRRPQESINISTAFAHPAFSRVFRVEGATK